MCVGAARVLLAGFVDAARPAMSGAGAVPSTLVCPTDLVRQQVVTRWLCASVSARDVLACVRVLGGHPTVALPFGVALPACFKLVPGVSSRRSSSVNGCAASRRAYCRRVALQAT